MYCCHGLCFCFFLYVYFHFYFYVDSDIYLDFYFYDNVDFIANDAPGGEGPKGSGEMMVYVAVKFARGEIPGPCIEAAKAAARWRRSVKEAVETATGKTMGEKAALTYVKTLGRSSSRDDRSLASMIKKSVRDIEKRKKSRDKSKAPKDNKG